VFAHKLIYVPNSKLGIHLHAGASVMYLSFALITSTGTIKHAAANANCLSCALLATIGMIGLVPAYVHHNNVLMASTGTSNPVSACASQEYAQ